MKNNDLQIIIAQLDFMVGDIDGNATQILHASRRARDEFHADIIVFPELTLTGYPPEDLLFRASIRIRVQKALARLCADLPADIYTLIGYPKGEGSSLYNTAGLIYGGKLVAEYHKQELPNYLVFDEKRYFQPGNSPCVFDIKGHRVGITICEDIWHEGPMSQAREAGARLMLNLNASPFHLGKEQVRKSLLEMRAREGNMPIVYANLVGAQDELVFDGGSVVADAQGTLRFRAPAFAAGLYPVLLRAEAGLVPVDAPVAPDQTVEQSAYRALVLAVRDYVNKNGFKGAVLGLSGGVDSALTLAVAVDALGADRVEAIMMPFRYTSQMSLDDAEAEAVALGVSYKIRPIEPMYEAFMQTLAPDFAGTARDTTEENLQARCRGVMLMALSNKKRYIVLTTGNKSEMAVGYATLYGDMAGGFDVLKDVPKTLVFKLCEYRNRLTPDNPPIPQRVIDRPPSAELAPDQKDEDSLPPYPELDAILEMYVERDFSADAIVAEGYEREIVQKVIRLVDLNEYKRRQAAIGARITSRAFGRDRRYPVTCKWPAGE
ncbi:MULTISPECIES: NAD+ synthase [unclassified Ketobacter]|uniref:NAD+ synthase n=1 Tax=unclassified Ketobacter TaxID=2639109 RepID=UPI000F11D0DB|nr:MULTISPECIES: NAD+ synthase [unclassified Ketobacter]RLT88195.1 MAG: NAD+ synthase [Ketobacter sp. GenoA1]RLT94124.1 MAG: NAD+ synthase [Ketobacter sp.]